MKKKNQKKYSKNEKDKVLIFDTTLRDGEQSPKVSLTPEEKIRIAKKIAKLKVEIIEAGFPAASDGDFLGVQLVANEIKGVQIAALARAKNNDITKAWEALKNAENPRIHTFIATSDIHLEYKLKMTKEQVLETAVKAVSYAASLCPNVQFSAEDATRSNLDFVCRVFEAVIEAGATTVNFPDTTGYAYPHEMYEMITYVIKNTKNIHKAILSVHCHNDLGLATANALEAVRAGARQVECTINGIGERAGNTAIEEIVMAIKTRGELLSVETDVNTKQIMSSSKLVKHLTGMVVQANKAIVGENAFAHESGIHQDGMLKNKLTYEIINPKDIGLSKSNLILGKHSGRKIIRAVLENLGYEISEEELKKIHASFKTLADKKAEIFPEDLEAILAEEVYRLPERYHLRQLQAFGGLSVEPTATLAIEFEGKEHKLSNIGVGPVDAAFKAIAKILKVKSKLVFYKVDSITGGTDAQAHVMVRLKEKGIKVNGYGTNYDIITASAMAYLNALNKLWQLSNMRLSNIKK